MHGLISATSVVSNAKLYFSRWNWNIFELRRSSSIDSISGRIMRNSCLPRKIYVERSSNTFFTIRSGQILENWFSLLPVRQWFELIWREIESRDNCETQSRLGFATIKEISDTKVNRTISYETKFRFESIIIQIIENFLKEKEKKNSFPYSPNLTKSFSPSKILD